MPKMPKSAIGLLKATRAAELKANTATPVEESKTEDPRYYRDSVTDPNAKAFPDAQPGNEPHYGLTNYGLAYMKDRGQWPPPSTEGAAAKEPTDTEGQGTATTR